MWLMIQNLLLISNCFASCLEVIIIFLCKVALSNFISFVYFFCFKWLEDNRISLYTATLFNYLRFTEVKNFDDKIGDFWCFLLDFSPQLVNLNQDLIIVICGFAIGQVSTICTSTCINLCSMIGIIKKNWNVPIPMKWLVKCFSIFCKVIFAQ